MAFMEFASKNTSGINNHVYKLNNPWALLKYAINREGPNGNYGIETGMFAKSEFQPRNNDQYGRPDIQMHSYPFISNTDFGKGWEMAMNFKTER